jgi:hypothetical protein
MAISPLGGNHRRLITPVGLACELDRESPVPL